MLFRSWRHWLEGAEHPFLVLTDHKNLEYLRSAKRLNPRQARWSLFFNRFRFSITFRPGTRNTKADALSRAFNEENQMNATIENVLPPEIIIAPLRWAVDEEIDQALATVDVPEQCPPNRKHVPDQFRDRVITWAHSSLSSGHPGETRTQQLISNRYWWENMLKDIHRFIASCSTCSQCKVPKSLPAGKLLPLPIPTRPWSHIAIDFGKHSSLYQIKI